MLDLALSLYALRRDNLLLIDYWLLPSYQSDVENIMYCVYYAMFTV